MAPATAAPPDPRWIGGFLVAILLLSSSYVWYPFYIPLAAGLVLAWPDDRDGWLVSELLRCALLSVMVGWFPGWMCLAAWFISLNVFTLVVERLGVFAWPLTEPAAGLAAAWVIHQCFFMGLLCESWREEDVFMVRWRDLIVSSIESLARELPTYCAPMAAATAPPAGWRPRLEGLATSVGRFTRQNDSVTHLLPVTTDVIQSSTCLLVFFLTHYVAAALLAQRGGGSHNKFMSLGRFIKTPAEIALRETCLTLTASAALGLPSVWFPSLVTGLASLVGIPGSWSAVFMGVWSFLRVNFVLARVFPRLHQVLEGTTSPVAASCDADASSSPFAWMFTARATEMLLLPLGFLALRRVQLALSGKKGDLFALSNEDLLLTSATASVKPRLLGSPAPQGAPAGVESRDQKRVWRVLRGGLMLLGLFVAKPLEETLLNVGFRCLALAPMVVWSLELLLTWPGSSETPKTLQHPHPPHHHRPVVASPGEVRTTPSSSLLENDSHSGSAAGSGGVPASAARVRRRTHNNNNHAHEQGNVAGTPVRV